MHRDAQNLAVPCETAHDLELFEAVLRYFLDPCEERRAALGGFDYEIGEIGEADGAESEGGADKAEARKAALVMQAANTVLDAEGREMFKFVAEQGSPVVCRAGCTGCCHQPITCDPFEAALIGLYLERRPELRAAFEAAHAEWDERTRDVRDAFVAWAERRFRDGVDDGSHRFADFVVPCVFLRDGLCRVYPVRPYACRSYISVSPACPAPADPAEKPGMQGMGFGVYTSHMDARAAVRAMLWRRFGIDPSRVRTRLMPELVRRFLAGGLAEALRCATAETPPGKSSGAASSDPPSP
ncbi:protein of unknown function UPF0153 [Desulfovibrio sp. X2]|uniref:YkgJ family cysteine cluster protein n=1 Tax=Desulfovibrio sp. X2 TaxID=941449 RepID=UPI000358BCFF|nr:YkgJ family cysteine cluster protein [Desulfovibrio sp. X2]EPR39859.1 protein of unknown function UPF0153 [Desulfovibrio sp. X2]